MAATGHLFDDMTATCHPPGVAGGWQARSSNNQWAFRHFKHRPRNIPISIQFLSKPVAPMLFMQQGIWILLRVPSSSVFQLRSAWTAFFSFSAAVGQKQWVRF